MLGNIFSRFHSISFPSEWGGLDGINCPLNLAVNVEFPFN
jgi:hypothetical protein